MKSQYFDICKNEKQSCDISNKKDSRNFSINHLARSLLILRGVKKGLLKYYKFMLRKVRTLQTRRKVTTLTIITLLLILRGVKRGLL